MAIQTLKIGGQTKRSKLGEHTVEIDFEALPEKSREFVIAYGLRQYIADGMAGAADQTSASVGVAARVKKLKEADFTRTHGDGPSKPDTEESRAIKLAREFIRAKLKESNATADKETVAEAATALIAADPQFRAEAKKQLAAEAKSKETFAEAGSDIIAGLIAKAAGNA